MDIMEIILLIAGGVIFVLSFFIPDKKGTSADGLSEEDVRKIIDRELVTLKKSLDEAVEDAVSDAMERTERSLERLSNEKIMAVNEYSDTVLAEIHKNHEEVMFLYDMLNNKHTSLKNTVAEVNRTVKEVEDVMAAMKRQIKEASEPESLRGQEIVVGQDIKVLEETVVEEQMKELIDAPEKETLAQSDEFGSNKEKIRLLYQQGKSVADIARELELGVGEVKLIIDLYQG